MNARKVILYLKILQNLKQDTITACTFKNIFPNILGSIIVRKREFSIPVFHLGTL